MLADLLNAPTDAASWEIYGFANKDIVTQIRQAIQRKTGNITKIIPTSFGAGYTGAPTVTITDLLNNGTGATAIAEYVVSDDEYSLPITLLTGGSGYIYPVVSFSGGGGSGATAQAEFQPIVKLTEYQLYPINFDRITDFLENNQAAHTDFNGYLGLQSSDLEEVDIKDKKQLQAWVYLVYQELYDACAALQI